jgi:hypothetical protein
MVAPEKAQTQMEVAMVAENSNITDKDKLKEYLYRNPDKLAQKLNQLLKDDDGFLLEPVKLKEDSNNYCYSIHLKRFVYISKNTELYLLPYSCPEDPRKCYVYSHSNWQNGMVYKVYIKDLERIGFN